MCWLGPSRCISLFGATNDRYVFYVGSCIDANDTPDLTFSCDLHGITSSNLLELVGPLKTPTSRLSQEVFMQHALSQNNIEDTKFVLHFKTKYAEKFYLEQLDWPNLLDLLRVTTSYSEAHSLAGVVFETVAHKVVPTLSRVTLFRMTGQPKKEKTDHHLSAKTSIIVDFARTDTISFNFSVPEIIRLSYYYRGCRISPIDGFLLSKTKARKTKKARIILYLLQFTTTQKERRSFIKGSQLVTEIVNRMTLTYRLPITIRFVLVGCAADAFEVEPEQSWELPDPATLAFRYEVYSCKIPIPRYLPPQR